MRRESEEVRSQLRATWSRKLYQWWHYYNAEYLNEALRSPRIELSQSEAELGRWDGARRCLSISVAHLESDPWLEVMQTLRHEMAHQYVDEVLGERGEGPHGAAFRRACEKLRCSPQARGLSGVQEEDERVLRVLKKVLSLAHSPNENEAQVAVEKARTLLLRYNVDLVDLDRERNFAQCSLGKVKGRRASYELWLASILQEFFFVESIWGESYEPLEDRKGTILQIYGTPANLEMASYVYEYLTVVLQRLWEDYKRARKLRGNRERQRYYVGVVEGFYRKLRQQEETVRGAGVLVWRGDSRLRAYFRYHNPHVRTTYGGSGVRASAAYKDGLEDGRQVTIHRPVTSSEEGFGGYLHA